MTNDKSPHETPDETPVEPTGSADQEASGSRWEPDPTADDTAVREPDAPAAQAPYVSMPLSHEPVAAPASPAPRPARKRLVLIGSAAAAAGLLVGGLGGFGIGLAADHGGRGEDSAFEHHGFGPDGDRDGEHGFAPPGLPGEGQQAPSTDGDDGSET